MIHFKGNVCLEIGLLFLLSFYIKHTLFNIGGVILLLLSWRQIAQDHTIANW